ncbi:hypothetical protein [Streptomyces roseoviridis]|uniref:Helix-turn-helix domain-containing protein n=1 Tax=Streptomyces roseoviridis TaxID=67361 RepID=A0ABV5QIT7_9ACTN
MSASPVLFDIPADAPRAGVIHVRYRHRYRFVVVGHDLAQHPDLSAVAIGLAVHIQSLPDGADVSVKRLTRRFREGEITIRRALNELVAAGYLERRRVVLGGGRFATRVIWYDKPDSGRTATASQAEAPAPEPAARPEADPLPPPEPRPVPRPETGPVPRPESEPVPRPEPRPAPRPETGPVQRPESEPRTVTVTATPFSSEGPAVGILARLRAVDSRLLLSWRDVHELAPAVDRWLDRSVSPEQITRTLTAALPPGHVPIHHPARFLAYRLAMFLPPPLPVSAPVPTAPPLITCDGCERAFRSHDSGAVCGDCRRAA